MNINDFVNERKGEWERLHHIASKFRPGSSSGLTKGEIWDLGRLSLAAISDLSLLRSSEFGSDGQNHVITYLNALIIKVHGMIYRKASFKWSSILAFFKTGFPSAVRNGAPYLAVSIGIFMLFGVMAFVLGLTKPEFIPLIVPEQIISKVESGKVWFNDLYEISPMASSGLMTHNITVTFLCVASGITFGIGTVYLLALNGLLLGSVAALCYKNGMSLEFWSFVLPHGSLELSAVFLGGAAALIMGHALLDPGQYQKIRVPFGPRQGRRHARSRMRSDAGVGRNDRGLLFPFASSRMVQAGLCSDFLFFPTVLHFRLSAGRLEGKRVEVFFR